MRKRFVYMIMVLPVLRVEAQPTPHKAQPTSLAARPSSHDAQRPIDVAKEFAATAMRTWPDSGDLQPGRRNDANWKLDLAMMRLWYATGDAQYYTYVKDHVDRYLKKEGNTANYPPWDNDSRLLLQLFEVTEKPNYYQAANREQRLFRPLRTPVKPVLIPGIVVDPYMLDPFRAQYAALFHEDSVFDDIARQAAEIEPYEYDAKTWLLNRHSSAGIYGMALVDALDYYPADNPGREALMGILQRYAVAVSKAQDAATGLWADAQQDPMPGDYNEASVSARFVYMLARGVKKGYLPSMYRGAAVKGWEGVRTCVVPNDPEAIGDVMLAAVEMDELYSSYGKGRKTVLLDYYFNNERRTDITGATVRYHYTWEDQANSGFSLLGHLFRQNGAHTDSLPVAPTPGNLRNASVYIIVDPDDDREVLHPNYPGPREIATIDDWVKAGGVLVLMSNDSANAEFPHFNVLAAAFGIHFNFDDYHKVTGSRYEMGAFDLSPNDGIFRTGHRIFIKEMSTLRLSPPAKAHFTDNGNVIMAVARVGRGTVFAIGDPWLYNEYTDGRKLPPAYENYNAARDLVQWLLSQAH